MHKSHIHAFEFWSEPGRFHSVGEWESLSADPFWPAWQHATLDWSVAAHVVEHFAFLKSYTLPSFVFWSHDNVAHNLPFPFMANSLAMIAKQTYDKSNLLFLTFCMSSVTCPSLSKRTFNYWTITIWMLLLCGAKNSPCSYFGGAQL